ncbi:hypothetical protein [Desulfovibrio piger]|uniref:hypothetical protein n=1 Tax=Desulfovibrio piger TaxID=901 RepID=UPI00242F5F85|nr:hypothetical protein [Desulfovibrio piger]MCI7507987.1 hypothetical protein [Desulfovibrio piger]
MLHAVIVLCLACAGWLTGLPGLAMGGACFYAGREHAQAEYRWIAAYGHGHRKNMPWWGGLDPRAWNVKSVADVLLPCLVAVCAEVFL